MSDIIAAAVFFALIGAWLTHIIVSIATGKFMLLVAGALLFPIGIIHGIGIWFGAW